MPRFVKKACLKRKALIVTQHQLNSRKQRSRQQHEGGEGGGGSRALQLQTSTKICTCELFSP